MRLSCVCGASYGSLHNALISKRGKVFQAYAYDTKEGSTVHATRIDEDGQGKTTRLKGKASERYISLLGGNGATAHTIAIPEGEKAAAALSDRLPDGWAVACYGASGSANRVLLHPLVTLSPSNIVLMPDADGPGMKAIYYLYSRLAKALPDCNITFTSWPDSESETGRDTADLNAGELTVHLASTAAANTIPKPKRQIAITGSDKALIIPRTSEGLEEALRYFDIDMRYNIRAQRVEVKGKRGKWAQSDDRAEADLIERIEATFKTGKKKQPCKFGRETWHRSLNALLLRREVDPFIEWLEALQRWDMTPRLDAWLTQCFDTKPDCQLTRWAGRFFMLGAIRRGYHPGAKMDEMPVLIGAQGSGKSTAVQHLLPSDDYPEWFADGLNLAGSAKERAEQLQGRVIVEAGEMSGSGRAELESLKAFLSRQDDGGVRLSYRRNPEPMPRRAIIVGTANSDPLPNDPTGNRRFVSIPIEAKAGRGNNAECVRAYLDATREQLWSEALWCYRETNAQAHLPYTLAGLQAEANEPYRRKDEVIEHAIQQWLLDAPDNFTLGQVAIGIGMVEGGSETNLDMSRQRRIGAVLTALGCVKERIRRDNARVWLWSQK